MAALGDLDIPLAEPFLPSITVPPNVQEMAFEHVHCMRIFHQKLVFNGWCCDGDALLYVLGLYVPGMGNVYFIC